MMVSLGIMECVTVSLVLPCLLSDSPCRLFMLHLSPPDSLWSSCSLLLGGAFPSPATTLRQRFIVGLILPITVYLKVRK